MSEGPSLEELLADTELLEYVAKHATPEQKRRFGPYLRQKLLEIQFDWKLKARANQLPPELPWWVWLILAGRGFGKTRTGAETAKAWAGYATLPNLESMPGSRGAIVAPTTGDARDTCVEGESGILAVLPDSAVKSWNRSMGELILMNGTRIKCFSADEPERLRGPQHHWAWCDETAAWRYPEAWDQLMFGLRLGENPKVVVTTTPKPSKLIKDLLSGDGVHVTRGSTFDNAANLAPAAVAQLKKKYEGTRLGLQELYAEVLTDTPGAVATQDQLSAGRCYVVPEMRSTVTFVDPAVSNTEDSDETGITVTGRGVDDEAYLLDDVSIRADVEDWALLSVRTAVKWKSAVLGYEENQGQDTIGALLRHAMQKLGVTDLVLKPVWASESKTDRAMWLQMWIQQERWHIVGVRAELEEQLTSWVPGGKLRSPDRLDSAVHGHRYLFGKEVDFEVDLTPDESIMGDLLTQEW